MISSAGKFPETVEKKSIILEKGLPHFPLVRQPPVDYIYPYRISVY